MTQGYPVMLNLKDRACAVVGGGMVATRKVSHLLEAHARVTVISPAVTPTLEALSEEGRVTLLSKPYSVDVLRSIQPVLVFAATDSVQVNQQVADDAHSLKIWANVVDNISSSDFSSMAVSQRPPLTIAWHTGGASPALSRHLRGVINSAIGDEYVILAKWLGDLRPQITQQVTSLKQRREIYETILASDVLSLLRQGQEQEAYQQLQKLVRART